MSEALMKENQTGGESALPAGKKRRLPLPKSAKGRRQACGWRWCGRAAALAVRFLAGMRGGAIPAGAGYTAVQVTRQDLTVTVAGSATLEPARLLPGDHPDLRHHPGRAL